jgi:predicted nucleic-acid-binding protein
MIALDTNVVVRVLTRDDPTQAERAAAVMASGPLWLPKTVLVEIEWVLRKGYGFERAAVNQALTALVSLENLSVEDAPAMRRALHWHAVGLDLADAVHLASSEMAERFVTFDAAFAATAERVGAEPGVERL